MQRLTFIVLALCVVACSSVKKDKKDLQEKAAASQVTDSKGLGQTIEEHIEKSQTLTDSQKQELRTILQENKRRAEELSAESYKFRSVLVQELLSASATPRRVRLLEKDIARIERQRLQNTFETVKKISKVVAGQPDKGQFAQEMLHMENPAASSRR